MVVSLVGLVLAVKVAMVAIAAITSGLRLHRRDRRWQLALCAALLWATSGATAMLMGVCTVVSIVRAFQGK